MNTVRITRAFVFFFITLMLSGCIISKSPSTEKIVVLPGSQQTFSVSVFPPGASFVWTLDGTAVTGQDGSYQYTPTTGQHTLTVTATHFLGTDTQTWTILDAEASGSIGSTGGTVAITDPNSAIAGTQIVIPAGALAASITVTISQATASPNLPGQAAGPCIDFGPSSTEFSSPVEITLPYLDADNNGIIDGTDVSEDQVSVWYFNENSSAWENVPIVSIDKDLNLVHISVTHFSEYMTSVPVPTWSKNIGGSANDTGQLATQTNDGGYILIGTTRSFGAGGSDILLVKTNAEGDEQWEKTFGGTQDDTGCSVLQTADGGYIVAGSTASLGVGGTDVWLIKTDEDGIEQWNKTFGNTDDDYVISVLQTTDGGFFLLEKSSSYRLQFRKTDANGTQEWIKTFDWLPTDIENKYQLLVGKGVQQTSDGGYIAIAEVYTVITTSTSGIDKQKNSTYLIKTDANGDKQWDKILTKGEALALQKTQDDGIILTGKVMISTNSYDAFLEKIDVDGNELWYEKYGNTSLDVGYDVDQTSDGGYILAGQSADGSSGWYLKTDAIGTEEWSKTFSLNDGCDTVFNSVRQISDDGYILLGTITFQNGNNDILLIKTDAAGMVYRSPEADAGIDQYVYVGDIVTLDGSNSTDPDDDIISYHWEQLSGPSVTLSDSSAMKPTFKASVTLDSVMTFKLTVTDVGGLSTSNECTIITIDNSSWNKTLDCTDLLIHSIRQTSDGGYILAGEYSLVKIDANGNELWSKYFYGTNTAERPNLKLYSFDQTTDGGYIMVGGSGNSEIFDVTLIKTAADGTEEWRKYFGGTKDDRGLSVHQTTDGGYIVAGYTNSLPLGTSGADAWLIKTDAYGVEQWNSILGGSDEDVFYSGQQTTDGGYINTGITWSSGAGKGDVWLVKTDGNGNKIWEKTFGGTSNDYGHDINLTSDGGYIIGGYTGWGILWLIKTNSDGNTQWNYTDSEYEEVRSVQQTSDGGFILVARAGISGEYYESYLIKTDANGNRLWTRFFDGGLIDESDNYHTYELIESVQQTSDGGYILAGSTYMSGSGIVNDNRIWIIKTDSNGIAPTYPHS